MKQISEIKSYIPQREPFIMVSELVESTENHAITRFIINKDNLFCNGEYFTEPGIIENIAQSAAAMNGYNAINNGENIKKGFIGSINNLTIFKLPKIGSAIETKITLENSVMNVNIIKGTVKEGDTLIAECEMKIFLEE